MSFLPVIPSSGLSGWIFLQKTYQSQLDTFNRLPQMDRDIQFFRDQIKTIRSASDLVSDRRLLAVALGAFGLQDDINNKYLIQKVLEDGTTDEKALANRLSDDRYAKISDAFGFGPGQILRTTDLDWMNQLAENYRVQEFERTVGMVDESMRIALFAKRELSELAVTNKSDDVMWYSVMGLPPLRALFEKALGLPKEFAQIDIDKQLDTFRDRLRSEFGDGAIGQFSDPNSIEELISRFHARSQIDALVFSGSASSNALTLLRSIPTFSV